MNVSNKSGAGNSRAIRSGSMMSKVWILRGALAFSLALNIYLFAGPDYFQSFSGPCCGSFYSWALKEGCRNSEERALRIALEKTSIMPNRTVMVTYLNEAWIAPNSMFDIFLESFQIGSNTRWLLNHLLVVSLDEKAHQRCLEVHPHCYHLQLNITGDAPYKSPNYLKIVWRKIYFLQTVLNLGFNFLFTDGDIMWLRDPFPRLSNPNSVDLQVACEWFNGNSSSPWNYANTGLMYVKSTPQTTLLYQLWYSARHTYNYKQDQEIFNDISQSPLFDIMGLRVNYLDTNYFNGFCQQTRDYSKVCTVHATCRVGLQSKVYELKRVLQDWRNYTSSSHN